MAATGAPHAAGIIEFMSFVNRLKHLPRTGWVRRGVREPETVASHMYGVAMCAIAADGAGADRARCIKMALVHDLAESLVGDITPHDDVAEDEKHALERDALAWITAACPNREAAAEVEALWREYEAGTTPEAKLVKDFDKFDMVMQASEYETAQGHDLGEFFDSVRGKWRTQEVAQWADVLEERRRSAAQ